MPDPVTMLIPGTQIPVRCQPDTKPLALLLMAYRQHAMFSVQCPEYPTRPFLFRQMVQALWGQAKAAQIDWHPWCDDISEVFHDHKYSAIAGCANSSKTTIAALYALLNWYAAPYETLVLVTSTSLKDAQKRIWGDVTKYYSALGGDKFFPGRLIQSQGVIRTDEGTGTYDERKGITLIAGEKKKEKESIGRLIGIKQRRIIFIADELPELSEALVEAAISNLDTAPEFQDFQMIGLGNLYSTTDPMGTFCCPKVGWENVSVEDKGWETKLGYCLHLDGMKSPNFDYDSDKWPFIYGRKSLKDHQGRLGENSVSFWRMCRAFIPPVGAENTIYSDADFRLGRAMAKPDPWLGMPVRVAFLDPGYTSGGDRSAAAFGSFGETVNHQFVLCLDEIKVLHEDATKKDYPRNYQIADLYVAECKTRGIKPEHAGLDATGGGREFVDRIADTWNHRCFALEFGGAPSMLPAPGTEGRKTCKDAFDRKVSELWHVGLEYVRSGQIKGLSYDLMRELKARKYELTRAGAGAGVKVKVQPKSEMKEEIGFSPDLGDAWCGLLQLARERLGFKSSGGANARQGRHQSWMGRVKSVDNVNRTLYAGK